MGLETIFKIILCCAFLIGLSYTYYYNETYQPLILKKLIEKLNK